MGDQRRGRWWRGQVGWSLGSFSGVVKKVGVRGGGLGGGVVVWVKRSDWCVQLAYQGEVEVVHVGSCDCGGLPEAVRRWVGDAEVGGVCARGDLGAAAAREYGWIRDGARG